MVCIEAAARLTSTDSESVVEKISLTVCTCGARWHEASSDKGANTSFFHSTLFFHDILHSRVASPAIHDSLSVLGRRQSGKAI